MYTLRCGRAGRYVIAEGCAHASLIARPSSTRESRFGCVRGLRARELSFFSGNTNPTWNRLRKCIIIDRATGRSVPSVVRNAARALTQV